MKNVNHNVNTNTDEQLSVDDFVKVKWNNTMLISAYQMLNQIQYYRFFTGAPTTACAMLLLPILLFLNIYVSSVAVVHASFILCAVAFVGMVWVIRQMSKKDEISAFDQMKFSGCFGVVLFMAFMVMDFRPSVFHENRDYNFLLCAFNALIKCFIVVLIASIVFWSSKGLMFVLKKLKFINEKYLVVSIIFPTISITIGIILFVFSCSIIAYIKFI